MSRIKAWIYLLVLSVSCAAASQAVADEETDAPDPLAGRIQLYPTVSLADLIKRVAGSPSKTFLIGEHVPAHIVTGDVGNGPLSYATFLTILRNNELTAAVSGDVVSIIPETSIRSHALRSVVNLEQNVPPDEWVNFIVRPQHASAPQMVPILRPLMPQPAHLAAFAEQNALLIVDRFANVKRIVGIVRQLDHAPSKE